MDFSDSSSNEHQLNQTRTQLLIALMQSNFDYTQTLDLNEDLMLFLDANGVELSKFEEALDPSGYCNLKFGINGTSLDSNGDMILQLLQSDLNR